MLNEIEKKLSVIDEQMKGLSRAVDHIEQSKMAAGNAAEMAIQLHNTYSQNLIAINKALDEVLQPHKELLLETDKITKEIRMIDFPRKLSKLENEIKEGKKYYIILVLLTAVNIVFTFFTFMLK